MNTTSRFLTLVLALCLLLAPALAYAQDGVQIEPMDENEMYYYMFWIPNPNVSFYLPLSVQASVGMELGYATNIFFENRALPDSGTIFFAFQNDMPEKPMDKMSAAELDVVQSYITSVPEGATTNLVKDFIPGETVMHIQEIRDGVAADHAVALHDGWIFNAMAYVPASDAMAIAQDWFPDDVIAFQQNILTQALRDSYLQQTYTLPGSDIKLTLPDSLYLMVSADEPNFQSISFPSPTSGVLISSLSLTANKLPEFEGQTVDTLTQEQLADIMTQLTVGGYDKDSVVFSKDKTGIPLFSFTGALGEGTTQHLVAIKDGWLLQLTSMLIGAENDEFMLSLQPDLMHALLSGEPMPEVTLPE